MPDSEQRQKANAFRAMHTDPGTVLLPNVWDAAGARIVEKAGFSAIATTSAGIAFANGFPDGQQITAGQMLAAVARITTAVTVPVTADIEAGYGETPDVAAATARQVIQAGAVGMNFEDATGDPNRPLADLTLQLERIRAIREVAEQLDLALVLNARTDVYLLQVGEVHTRYDEAVRRLSSYRDAGADCVFIPGIRDIETIRRVVLDLRCPVNILAVPGSPSVRELAELGVKRISLGSGPMRAAMGLLRRIAEELKTAGTYDQMAGAPSHAAMNKLMGARPN